MLPRLSARTYALMTIASVVFAALQLEPGELPEESGVRLARDLLATGTAHAAAQRH